MKKYLVINLQGIFQYYAVTNGFVVTVSDGYYKTEKCPTRNALVGMIGCAMGIERKSPKLDDLKKNLDFKYRLLKEGIIYTDYQTIHGLIDPETDEQLGFHRVGGGIHNDGTGLIKRVEYLNDYKFEGYIGSEDESLLEDIKKYFHNPVWSPYLGKRVCIPSVPIVTDGKILTEKELEEINNVYDCP